MQTQRLIAPYFSVPPPQAVWMSVSPENQCHAAHDLVRPWETEHLIRDVWLSTQFRLNRGDFVAAWFRQQYRTGALRYIKDPPIGDYWRSPAMTLRDGGGDCDDTAVLGCSMLLVTPESWATIVIGTVGLWFPEGHAWVEGVDEGGPFLLETTSGELIREIKRPSKYKAHRYVNNEVCRPARKAR